MIGRIFTLAAAWMATLALAGAAGAATLDFEASPPADGDTITTQYANVDPPYGGVEFHAGDGTAESPFQSPTVESVSGKAHSGKRVLAFSGQTQKLTSGLWASFDTPRQTLSLYLTQATSASATSDFTYTGYDASGDSVASGKVELDAPANTVDWHLITLSAPGTDSSRWISTLKLTGDDNSAANTFYVDDVALSEPAGPPPPSGTAPSADFTCSPSCSVTAGATVTFTASSNLAQPSYSWDLEGEGEYNGLSGSTVAQTYVVDGPRTISLRATDPMTGQSVVVSHPLAVGAGVAQVPRVARVLQTDLILLTSSLGRAVLGPEHDQPMAPAGPSVIPTIPKNDRLPTMRMRAPTRRVRAGSLVTLSLGVKAARRVQAVSWDLDGDGQRNDAYGTSVTYPVTCPGRNTVRAEVVDGYGLHVGDQAAVRVTGSVSPPSLARAMTHARLSHGSLRLAARFGAWQHLGTAFGSRPQRTGSIPIERTLRTIGSVGGDYARVGEPVDNAHGAWVSSWRSTKGIKHLTPDAAGETATGVLLSPRFVLRHRYLTFWIGGRNASCNGRPAESATLYVQRRGHFVAVHGASATPGDQDQMHPVVLKLPARLMKATAILVVRDGSAAGHVNVSRFANLRIPLTDLLEPAPVVGWADTHEHLDAHQGFGGLDGVRTYMGVPGSAYVNDEPAFSARATPAQRLAAANAYEQDVRDTPTHFSGPLGQLLLPIVHGLMNLSLNGTSLTQDVPSGLKNMFSAFHEQFQITELHRAWEGGMRLISSLAINNAALGYLLGTPDAHSGNVPLVPDLETIEAHVQAMRELAAANSDWMEIVYSPTEAQRVISDGKLAVVLGTEVDQLGALGFSTPEAEVDWLWRIGIRQVTPIHSINNSLGGAAIFQDVYDMANDLVNRHTPDGHSTTQSTTSEIAHDISQHGIEGAPPNTLTTVDPTASYGYFFRTTTRNECLAYGVSPPDCVGYTLAPLQLSIGVHSNALCFLIVGCLTHGPTPLVVGANGSGDGDLPNIPGSDVLDTEHAGVPSTGGTNLQGLTGRGEEYIDALERHGMLVDMEHMSDASVRDLLNPTSQMAQAHVAAPAWLLAPRGCNYAYSSYEIINSHRPIPCMAQAYPYMSSHTSFRNQSLSSVQTRTKDFLRREFERTDTQIQYIDQAGGTVAPVVLQDPNNTDDPAQPGRRSSVTNPDAPRLNDCAGSSKSWVAAYLWAINHTENHRIALATDMAVVGGTGARFWDHSSNPTVPNNCPASSGAALGGLNINIGRIVDYLNHPGDIAQDELTAEHYEERRDGGQYQHDQPIDTWLHYSENPITGAALRPDSPPVANNGAVIAESRDFNTQGMLTIGQLPDLLQDAVNDGMSARDLAPLLNSAQSYLDMWNKAERLNGCLDRYDLPTRLDATVCQGPDPSGVDLSAQSICRWTCPDNPGDGSTFDPAGRRFDYSH